MALRMAYSPTLLLKESYVALYKIYTLRNPFTGEIFYVGQTLQEPQTRLSGHIHQGGDVNPEKNEYIKAIIDKGGKPMIEVVETIPGTCRIDKALVNEREIYWIKYYKSIGIKLLNIASTHDEAECREYKAYLRAIKAGEGDYRHYYCGVTHGGYEVYDEKKMIADGFHLPPEESSFVKIVERVKEVERIVDRVRIVREIITVEAPTKWVKTDYFWPDPSWTPEFAASIPPPEDFMDNFEIDESEYETDDSDYEPDNDFEPDYEMEDEELEEDETGVENYEANVIYANRDIPFYVSNEFK